MPEAELSAGTIDHQDTGQGIARATPEIGPG